EPLDRSNAGSRLARAVRFVIDLPELPPAGVEEDGVARADLVDPLHRQRPFDVLDRDHISRIEALDALVARDVEQHATREEPADVLDAELRQAVSRAELR